MRASELALRLAAAIRQNGDLDVVVEWQTHDLHETVDDPLSLSYTPDGKPYITIDTGAAIVMADPPAEPQVAAHPTVIEVHKPMSGAQVSHRAGCKCGWRGRWWNTLQQAQRDEAGHARATGTD